MVPATAVRRRSVGLVGLTDLLRFSLGVSVRDDRAARGAEVRLFGNAPIDVHEIARLFPDVQGVVAFASITRPHNTFSPRKLRWRRANSHRSFGYGFANHGGR